MMEDGSHFATPADAQVEARSSPPGTSNNTNYAKGAAVRVRVHDETPLLHQTSETPGYGSLSPSYEDSSISGVDRPRWRRPSVS